ncbi:MAG: stress protection protein MarC [Flavobacteriaceae bacterium CG_4_8_14_3_um_filter_34_10]|nr:MarC family NAAT transporter [Flavobacteriia bacterium]OIP50341.1 MAG: antibiotic resistance protein MarC [Flavobacteriaceae bacterium CG2_30_34_30]PIQ18420.1 MAG: stress protection protein MarC [Flavobacteriaceae bacterium CG18_big_fil_WC_8_21_14_2_50_34_36]PIV49851.1 MAG: stress protection protein MarC [Flavobacteriaceae bacterium CG02_land_8_20_14_3_00_34_13]PIX10450.1 MAG: stress protection protein MarC [Flavobacteriaceae bacterium CG_4_8_14_3_um_filter_34_10]PIZ06888.1 MAG: stress prot
MELFIYVFAALFSVMNPLGTVPVFVGLTQEEENTERNKTCLLTSINVFVILLISFFTGKYLLSFFGISLDALRIAGGLIIVTSGFALLTGSFSKHKGMKNKRVQNDLAKRERFSLTPLAIPMLAGPGSISMLIALNQKHQQTFEILITIAAILAVCLATFVILRSSYFIVRFFGASGINAISRIIGFIIIAIGVEYISSSVVSILKSVTL